MDNQKACSKKDSFISRKVYTCCYTISYLTVFYLGRILDSIAVLSPSNPVSTGVEDGACAARDTLEWEKGKTANG